MTKGTADATMAHSVETTRRTAAGRDGESKTSVRTSATTVRKAGKRAVQSKVDQPGNHIVHSRATEKPRAARAVQPGAGERDAKQYRSVLSRGSLDGQTVYTLTMLPVEEPKRDNWLLDADVDFDDKLSINGKLTLSAGALVILLIGLAIGSLL